jgi:hypothetical protein
MRHQGYDILQAVCSQKAEWEAKVCQSYAPAAHDPLPRRGELLVLIYATGRINVTVIVPFGLLDKLNITRRYSKPRVSDLQHNASVNCAAV